MGTRAQCFIVDAGIYLYQHYDGYDLPQIVRDSLATERAQNRANDPEYLARIVFEDMINDHLGTETGYGIGTTQHRDIEYLVTVECANRTLTVHHLDVYGNHKRLPTVERF